ncbi:HAMP domain-containing histidine kinase [bacterium]|nr:HAMP domain-containing histidine kinase [bacterium]
MEVESTITGRYRNVGQFKGFLFISAVLIIMGALFYTQYLVEQLRSEARRSLSMNIEHYKYLLDNATPDLAFEEIKRIEIPLILTDADNNPKFWRNVGISLGDTTIEARRKLQNLIVSMDKVSRPIALEYTQGFSDYLHFGDSMLITQLRWLPVIEISVVGLFILIGYLGFKNIKTNEQRSVWVGMARETAHQLGTPISSLLGWMELLKTEESAEMLIPEMESDIARLEKITARFSQIGSEVKLNRQRIIPIIQESMEYFRRRIPQTKRKVQLVERYECDPWLMVNAYLLEWVIENLVRNGLDAIKGDTGIITVSLSEKDNFIAVDVTDTGHGIEKINYRNIFRPGYTSKKRGWGVGLSLAKRIIADYHQGKIFVKESHPGQGTTIRILLPKQ